MQQVSDTASDLGIFLRGSKISDQDRTTAGPKRCLGPSSDFEGPEQGPAPVANPAPAAEIARLFERQFEQQQAVINQLTNQVAGLQAALAQQPQGTPQRPTTPNPADSSPASSSSSALCAIS